MGKAAALALAAASADIAIGSLTVHMKDSALAKGENTFTPEDAALRSAAAEIGRLGVRAFAAGLDVAPAESVRDVRPLDAGHCRLGWHQ
jgi:hypothetical protein